LSEVVRENELRSRHFIPDIARREALLVGDVGYRKLASRDSRLLPLPHESIPRPSYIVHGKPLYVLAPSFALQSKDDLIRSSVQAYDSFIAMIGSLLGPRRLYKLYINEKGTLFLLGSLSAISKLVSFRSPFLDIVIGAGVSMSRSVGDHSVYTTLLSSLLVKKCLEVIEKGEGSRSYCLRALWDLSKLVSGYIEGLSYLSVYKQSVDRARLLEAAKGWLGNYYELLTKLAHQAYAIIKSVGLNFNLLRIEDVVDVRVESDGLPSDSFVLNGVAFPKEIPYISLPRKMSPARIAVLLGGLVLPTEMARGFNFKFDIDKERGLRIIREGPRLLFEDYLKDLLSLGVNVLVIEKGIDENVLSLLSKFGLMAVRRFAPPEIESVALATGARPVPVLHPVGAGDLGYAEVVEYRKTRDKEWILFSNCRRLHRITVVIQGIPQYMTVQVEQAFKELLYFLDELDRNPLVVPGGGALEAGLAVFLRRHASHIGDRRQLILMKLAEAFEDVISCLVKNAGGQPLDVLVRLRKEHAAGNHAMGFNALRGDVANVMQEGIVDLASIKKRALLNAIQAAYTIIRIDTFMVDRPLSKEEGYYKKRTEALKENKVAKEYGLEIGEIKGNSYT
jgi:chaperonin GroEL (HSP60 family)